VIVPVTDCASSPGVARSTANKPPIMCFIDPLFSCFH
jgi:hypothetical protein